jgi:hypothetical protein
MGFALGFPCALRAGFGGRRKSRKGSGSFLKKRTKKLLRGCHGVVRDSRAEVFASFFQKEALPYIPGQ